MSDTDNTAPADPTFSSDSEGAHEAADEIRRRRAAGSLAPLVVDEVEPAAPVVSDGEEGPLTVRQAGRSLGPAREALAAAARAALGEADGGSPRGQVDQPSPSEINDQARAPPVDPTQLEAQRAQVDADREHRISTLDAGAQYMAATVKQARREVEAAFADIKTTEDLAALRDSPKAEDRERYALFEQCRALIEGGEAQVNDALGRQYDARKAEYQQFATQSDEAWLSLHPEYEKDPVRHRRDSDGAVRTLKEVGLTDENINELWRGERSILLRDPATQEVIWRAAQWTLAQQGLAQARTDARAGRQPEAVLRPGVRQEKVDGVDQVRSKAERVLSRSTGLEALRAGKQHLQAMRKLGRL